MGTTFLYSRVSTSSQAEEGHSLNAQADWATRICREKGWGPIDVTTYREEGEHGDKLDRPKLKRLLLGAAKGQVERVIVYMVDRLARNLDDQRLILKWLGEHGVKIYFGDLPEAGDDARLLLGILGAINEHFLEVNRKKTRAGLAQAKNEGIKLGRPTVGVEWIEGNPPTPKILPWISELRREFGKDSPGQSGEDIEKLRAIAATKKFGTVDKEDEDEFHPLTAWGLRNALLNAKDAEDGTLLSKLAERESGTKVRRQRHAEKKKRARDLFELELRKALLGVA